LFGLSFLDRINPSETPVCDREPCGPFHGASRIFRIYWIILFFSPFPEEREKENPPVAEGIIFLAGLSGPSEISFAVVNEFHEVNPVQRGESVSNSKREKVERESCEKDMILCGPFPGWWF